MLINYVVILSFVIQLTTAFLALRLIKTTEKHLAWVFIAIAMLLQASRRIYTFFGLISGEIIASQVTGSEWVELVISAFMFMGVAGFGLFLKKSERSIQDHAHILKVLQESDKKYRNLFENNPQPMWIYDLETLYFLEVNEAAVHHYGYSRDEFLSMTLKDIRPKEDIEALLKDVEKTRKTYNPAGEWRHLKKNGELMIVEIISHTITFNNRKARHVMVTDITEHKHNELLLTEKNQKIVSQNEEYAQINEDLIQTNEELNRAKEIAEENEKKYKLLYDFNPMPMSIFDIQTLEFLSANEAFCDKYGYTREEFLNMTILEIRPDTEIEKLKQSVSLIDKGITNAGIFLHKKKNGEIIQVEIIRHEIIFDNRVAKLVLINDVTDKLKAEAVLTETQLKLNEAYKLAHIGIWEWETDTDTVTWTEELYHIAGLDPFLPAPSFKEQANLYAPESYMILNTLVERTFETSEPYQTELELIRPDGDIRYVKAFGGAKRDAKGQIKGLFGTLQDITELKQVQEVLREREYLLSASQRASHIGTWSWKVGATKVFWSEETYRIYGLNPDMGPPDFEFFFEIIHPDDRQKMQEWPTEVISGLHPAPVEFRVLRPDGIYRIIRTDGDVIEWVDGIPSRIAGTAYDITESKQAEAAINAKHELFRKTFNISPLSSVLTKLPERTIVEVNPAFEKLFGYTSTEVIGKSVKELDLWADSSEQMRVAQILLEKGKVHDFEFEFKTKVGKSGSGIFYSEVIEQLDEKYVLTKIMDITERKLAEEALKKSRQLLAETELIGKVGGWEINTDSMDTTWTDEVYTIHEIELHSYQNVEKGINFYSPESRPLIEKAVQRAIEFGEPFDVELEIITAKGNLRNVHAIGKSDPEHHRVYGFFQDITDRKQAEEELRTSEAKFRAVAELSPIAIYASSGADQKAIYINEAFYKIFGFSMEDVPTVGHWWIKAFPDENYRQQVIDQWVYNIEQAAINNMDVEALECVCTSNDGSEKIIVWVGKTIADEFWAFGYDITGRKLAEEEIRQLNERIATATMTAQVGIWDWDIKNDNLIWDDQMYALYGLKKDDFKGAYESWVNGLHPEDREYCQNEVRLAFLGEKEYDAEFRIVWPDGIVRYIKSKGEVFRAETGDPMRMVGVNYDITDRKKAEENIRILNEELEQRVEERTTQLQLANKELESFSYSVSHDLRAPLRHINGYVDLLNGRYEDNLPEKARHYLATITDAAKQMGKLIDDLLQFSRTGRQEIRKAMLDMNVLVKEVLEQIKPDVEKREIIWSVQKMPMVFGDYSLLKQVWVNLLDNAVKYTKYKKTTEITIAFSEEKANFVFLVRDNGVGFNMKYAHKLFGVFQRLHSQTEFEGTGIGLANVQRIIHKHNGTVWAEAEPNMGATFFFTIPKNKEDDQ